MSSSHYTHGTSPAEQQRLTALNHLLNKRFLAQAALAPGERIVDFGAGLGQFSRAMAKVIGMPVVGIERSNEQILEAMRQADAAGETHLIDMRQGNAEIAPLTDGEWGHFDMAHAWFCSSTSPIRCSSCEPWFAPCARAGGSSWRMMTTR
jgi:cyclopropane fatty-acyl-phospholipid synthase-like methyltransferase